MKHHFGHSKPSETEKVEQVRYGYARTFFLFFRIHKDIGPQIFVYKRTRGSREYLSLPCYLNQHSLPVVNADSGHILGGSLLSQMTVHPSVSIVTPYNEMSYGSLTNNDSSGKPCGYSIGVTNTNPHFGEWGISESKVQCSVLWVDIAELTRVNMSESQHPFMREILIAFATLLRDKAPSWESEVSRMLK